jgi:hypothetical protein
MPQLVGLLNRMKRIVRYADPSCGGSSGAESRRRRLSCSTEMCRDWLDSGAFGELRSPIAIEVTRSRDLGVRRAGAERDTQGVRPRLATVEGGNETGQERVATSDRVAADSIDRALP